VKIYRGRKIAGPPPALERVLQEHGLELGKSVDLLNPERREGGVGIVDDIRHDCTVILVGAETGVIREVHLVELKKKE
jgi:hypothetical protein